MTNEEMNQIAEKMADIIIEKQDERAKKQAEMMAHIWWNTPMKTQQDYAEELKGKTGRQIIDSLND